MKFTITKEQDREKKLVSHGVPIPFLKAVSDPAGTMSLFCTKPSDNNYTEMHFPENSIITPIYERLDGVLISLVEVNNVYSFWRTSLENEQQKLGTKFSMVLFHLSIEVWESADHLIEMEIVKIMSDIGYKYADKLMSSLLSASRDTFEEDKLWRTKNVRIFS